MQEKDKKNVPFQAHFYFIQGRGDSVAPSLLRKFKLREFFLFYPYRIEELSRSRVKDITLYVCSEDYILG